jgi:hypothetical protein
VAARAGAPHALWPASPSGATEVSHGAAEPTMSLPWALNHDPALGSGQSASPGVGGPGTVNWW